MSPRGSSAVSTAQSARSTNTPYSRRSSSQPKSSRQQFSACGACRMRRVRCDLKDLPIGSVGPHPACSNCKERGIKCIDEFADVKAVKLLRRGRRLQQVEAIYGKVGSDQDSSQASKIPSSIPILHADFFASPFWRWLTIQRPVLDVAEFPMRFAAHCKGAELLGNEGGLIAMLLVTWAASFGLDERGRPQSVGSPRGQSAPTDGSKSSGPSSHPSDGKFTPPSSKRAHWKDKSELYLREILELVDYHGLLRRPTLDGVRALLLLLPLMEEAQPLERLAIHEATMSQVQSLCVLSASSPPTYEEGTARARIFWYAYTQEGLTTGIRGSRFVLNVDDLETFQRTLPSTTLTSGSPGLPSTPSSATPLEQSPGLGDYPPADGGNFSAREVSSHNAYIHLMHAASTPLELSGICRKIHSVLTGSKATRRAEDHGLVDANGMRDIWRDLDRCWQDLDSMRRAPIDHDNTLRRLEISQYASGWQIFIFECHNVIRETLKQFSAHSTSQSMYSASSPQRPSSHSSNSSPYLSPQNLHAVATRRCLALLPRIIRILQFHTPGDHSDISNVFRWDSGLVRDGCFFAGYLAASVDGEYLDIPGEEGKQQDPAPRLTVEEGVSVCLETLETMRWGYSKSDEREETVRMIWQNRKIRRQGASDNSPVYDSSYPHAMPLTDPHILSLPQNSVLAMSLSPTGDRPMLPPLAPTSQRRVESAPNTGSSTDGRGVNGWPSYTPPGTGTSISSSAGTGLSGKGSPAFSHLPAYKSAADELFYHSSGHDMDQFTYNVPLTGGVREASTISASVSPYPQRHSSLDGHTLVNNNHYLAPSSFDSSNAPILTEYHSCPQFGENCSGTYH